MFCLNLYIIALHLQWHELNTDIKWHIYRAISQTV